jgi:hypothetical protein
MLKMSAATVFPQGSIHFLQNLGCKVRSIISTAANMLILEYPSAACTVHLSVRVRRPRPYGRCSGLVQRASRRNVRHHFLHYHTSS